MSLASYILSSGSEIVAVETIELYHSAWSSVYRWARNSLTDIVTSHGTFSPIPLEITRDGVADDLDLSYSVRVGDLGEIIQVEIDRVATLAAWDERPTAVYRVYRSDLLTSPIIGPVTLECVDWQFDDLGFRFSAQAPRLNIVATGSLYRVERFPMLAGFANDQS